MIEMPLKYTKEEYIQPPRGGHSACPGCGEILAMRYFLKAMGGRVILMTPPGCSIVVVRWPSPSLPKEVRRIATAFGSTAHLAAGLKTALMARGDVETKVVAWAGDGATFDIGFQGLSGAAERNESIIYVCYDNEAYMNTGNQRSSATPWAARTTTNPLPNPKMEDKKDIMWMMMGHRIPYAATATIAYPDDLMQKARKAKDIKGFRFLHILIPCVTGWQFPAELTIKVSRLAVETKAFPLFEVEDGTDITINKEPEGIPVADYIKIQGRYRHLTSEQIAELQRKVDEKWHRLQWLANYRNNELAVKTRKERDA